MWTCTRRARVFLVACCILASSCTKEPAAAAHTVSEPNPDAIEPLLERLMALRREKGHPLEPHLRPGLSDTEIDAQAAPMGAAVPEELRKLWRWRDGSTPEAPALFRDMQFLSVADAVREKEGLAAYRGLFTKTEWDGAIPIASFQGAAFVVATRGHSSRPLLARPIVYVGEGVEIQFLSLEHMLKTAVAWYEVGAHDEHGVSVPEEQELTIWRRINPGVF